MVRHIRLAASCLSTTVLVQHDVRHLFLLSGTGTVHIGKSMRWSQCPVRSGGRRFPSDRDVQANLAMTASGDRRVAYPRTRLRKLRYPEAFVD